MFVLQFACKLYPMHVSCLERPEDGIRSPACMLGVEPLSISRAGSVPLPPSPSLSLGTDDRDVLLAAGYSASLILCVFTREFYSPVKIQGNFKLCFDCGKL